MTALVQTPLVCEVCGQAATSVIQHAIQVLGPGGLVEFHPNGPPVARCPDHPLTPLVAVTRVIT